MRVVVLLMLVVLVACSSSKPQQVAIEDVDAPNIYIEREVISFDFLLASVNNKAELDELRHQLSDQEMQDWMAFQQSKCNDRFPDVELAERCLANELKVAELFYKLPIDQISDEEFLLSKEIYAYYLDAQIKSRAKTGEGGAELTQVKSAKEYEVLQLTEVASPLAIYIVSLREVLTAQNDVVY